MAIPRIISRSDFTNYVEVAANLVDAKLFPRILEAENFDLCGLMGDAFFYDFIAQFDANGVPLNTMSADYLLLYNGGSYTYKDTTYQQQGIKPVLVYFASARLIRSLDLHITPNGVMYKRNEYSDHVDMKAIGAKATEYENIAISYWNKCASYINASGKTNFPKWNGFACGDNEGSGFRNRVYGIQGESLSSMGKVDNYYGRR